jgi:shikimate kinase
MSLNNNPYVNFKTSIFLVGMMGSWKSTIGKKLAEKTNLNFIDIDDEIEGKTSKMIVDIFNNDGEVHFRKLESKILRESVNGNNQIISTGGGVILLSENRSILKTKGYTVYLKASPQVLANRIQDVGKRPLLNASISLITQLENILIERESFYNEVAQFILDTDFMTSNDATQAIINHMRINNANNPG